MGVGDIEEDTGGGTIEWLLPVGWSWAKTGVTGEYGGRGGVPCRGGVVAVGRVVIVIGVVVGCLSWLL